MDITFYASLAAMLMTWGQAQQTGNLATDIAPMTEHDGVCIRLSSQQYDSLYQAWHDRTAITSYEYFYDNFIDIDSLETLTSDIPDNVYETRLKALLSPIGMPFNDVVKQYILLYSSRKKADMERIIGLSEYYMPLFEDELARQGIPLELKYLPVVESALIPTAISRVGAGGLWQFMPSTGKLYGLEINSFVDERFDPVLSTRAACQYLKELYGIFNDWTLALAAYNSGPGRVAAAIKRAGPDAKTFWDIYPYLPRETRGYVPSFIAVNYTFAYHKHHGIEPRSAGIPWATDTVMVNRLTHLEQISETIGTPMTLLRALNPQYKKDIIPYMDSVSYPVTLPSCDVLRFIEEEAEIMAKDTVYLAEYLQPSGSGKTAKKLDLNPSVTHVIKSGDTLGALARKYRTTVKSIMSLNRIKNPNALRIGQRITIR